MADTLESIMNNLLTAYDSKKEGQTADDVIKEVFEKDNLSQEAKEAQKRSSSMADLVQEKYRSAINARKNGKELKDWLEEQLAKITKDLSESEQEEKREAVMKVFSMVYNQSK